MATEREIRNLEKAIFTKMVSIKNKLVSPKDSGIGRLFTILKSVDEVSYEKHISEYKKILNGIK